MRNCIDSDYNLLMSLTEEELKHFCEGLEAAAEIDIYLIKKYSDKK